MSRRRIAILGGGIGGLTTAYHLSRTPELRDMTGSTSSSTRRASPSA